MGQINTLSGYQMPVDSYFLVDVETVVYLVILLWKSVVFSKCHLVTVGLIVCTCYNLASERSLVPVTIVNFSDCSASVTIPHQ